MIKTSWRTWGTLGAALVLVLSGAYLGRASARDADRGRAARMQARAADAPSVVDREIAPVSPGAARPLVEPAPAASAAPSPADAPPDPPMISAEQERDDAIARVRSSGPANREVLSKAAAASKAWEDLARAKGQKSRFSAWECFVAGCFITISHESSQQADDAQADIVHSDEFRDWPGGKMRSGELPGRNGEVDVTWILYNEEGTAKHD